MRTESGRLLLRMVDRHAADRLSPGQALLRAVNRHAADNRETRSARTPSNVAPPTSATRSQPARKGCPVCGYVYGGHHFQCPARR
jgi:hypothetical protein